MKNKGFSNTRSFVLRCPNFKWIMHVAPYFSLLQTLFPASSSQTYVEAKNIRKPNVKIPRQVQGQTIIKQVAIYEGSGQGAIN